MVVEFKRTPIWCIASYNPKGEVSPLYFKYEDANREQHTVTIERVKLRDKTNYAGFGKIHFTCEVTIQGTKQEISLTYENDNYTWYLRT